MTRNPEAGVPPQDEALLILVLGGTAEDRAALRAGLSRQEPPRFVVEHLDQPGPAVPAAELAAPAAIVLDLAWPEAASPELRQRLRERWPTAALVVLAAPEQESLAWSMVQDGAQDYLVRGRADPKLVLRTVRGAIERQRLVTELARRTADLERRIAELEPSETRFRRLIERNADGIVIVDDDGLIRFINPAAEALFGRAAAELIGEQFGFPVVTGETTEIDVVRRGGDPITAELRAVDTVWAEEKACLISLRDITDRKQAAERERQLVAEQAARQAAEDAERRYRQLAHDSAALADENARLYEEAQEANRAKADFLAVMSHELRTPLNAVIGYGDLLDSELVGSLNPKQHEQLERILANARHLVQLVEEILTYARMESGRESVQPSTVDLAALLDEVRAVIEPLAREKGLAFHIRPAPGSLDVQTDGAKVRQILFNLLTNAVSFTERGEVRLELEPQPDTLVFRVVDTGIGISAANLERVWEPFWQVEQAQTRTVGGTGLGLSLVQRLTRLLGGTIEVDSEPGHGSTFTLRLPRHPPPAAAADPPGPG